MTVPRTGAAVALALAGGIAIGAVGSVLGASPSSGPLPSADPWTSMAGAMSGVGMMGSAGLSGGVGMMGSAGLSGGVGMMGALDPAQREALLERCDALHDAMHSAASNAMPYGGRRETGR